MLGRLFASVLKEIIVFWRDPRARAMLFVVPVVQVTVFGLAATLEVHHVELAVINDDNGRWSRELIARVEAAGFVDRVTPVADMADFSARLERRQILLGLQFPADFSRDVAAGHPAKLQVIIDGRRSNAGQVAASYLLAIAAYNAGPSRAKRWIQENGDPRDTLVDAVDWVEMIPFAETRNYVQRVLENLQVYRARLTEQDVALNLEQDLKR